MRKTTDGQIVDLDERRRAKLARRTRARTSTEAEFAFDLSDPFTYLDSERVDRAFTAVTWVPASSRALRGHLLAPDDRGALRRRVEGHAAELRMPLVWPERFPATVPMAMRVATFAVDRGRGAEFVLAAGRLAFCGGFDLDDLDVLAEAVAAAGLTVEECFAAGRDRGRERRLDAAGRRLVADGAVRLPVLRVGDALHCDTDGIAAAAAAARFAATELCGR